MFVVCCVCVCVNFPSKWEQMVTLFASLHKMMIGQLHVKVSCNRLHLAGGRRGCRGTPSNEAFPCTLGQRGQQLQYTITVASGGRREQLRDTA